MKKLRIVYMGTPAFAVPCLDRLLTDGHEIVAVVTQPDRPKGRGQKLAFSPVKEAANIHNLPILQPEKVKEPSFLATIADLNPDIIVVVAFGQFLPKPLLDLPVLGCINVHASLLPYYRGAAPIHWSIMKGEITTGITTMYMDVGMDTGDMILKANISIGDNETTGELHDRLKDLGAQVLSETLSLIAQGKSPRQPQDHTIATYASLLKREHEKVNWANPARAIHNQVRGLNPWPGAYTLHNENTVKVWRTQLVESTLSAGSPGKVIAITTDTIVIECGEGKVALAEVQPANKRRMTGGEYARGYGLVPGDFFT